MAKDLGTFGETFEIQEKDLIEVIQGKLKRLEADGTLKTHQEKIKALAKKRIQRPEPVQGITRSKKYRSLTYDPTLILPYDLKDHQGRVFQKSGTKINPLKIRPFTKTLVFIDGDDEEQVFLAAAKKQPTKIILVSGSPFELMKQLGTPIYFDQGGKLTKKLGIQHVPARVYQQGLLLQIEELPVDRLCVTPDGKIDKLCVEGEKNA